jgi:hypothetical protein
MADFDIGERVFIAPDKSCKHEEEEPSKWMTIIISYIVNELNQYSSS